MTTEDFTHIEIKVAPGTGRVARRPGAVLFDPTGNAHDLIAGFDTAGTDEEALTAVKRQLIDGQFTAPPVVLIDWRPTGVGLLVFGEVQVHTSVPAAPMVSGSGSGTWIERTLGPLELGVAAEVQVWTGAATDADTDGDTDADTDLRLGVVRAGAIRVELHRIVESGPSEIPPPEPEEANPRPVPAPAPLTNGIASGRNGWSTDHEPTNPPTEPPIDVRFEDRFTSTLLRDPRSFDRPTVAEPVAHEQSSSVATAIDPFTDGPSLDFEDQLTEPADRRADLLPGGLDEVRSATAGLIEASRCPNGHVNPPQYLVCRTCAVDLDPDADIELVAQPTLGDLRFDNGVTIEVDGPMIIGRKPVAGNAAVRAVVVDHAEVSRNHVEVALDGWSVLVTDAGSRNGTWVIPPTDRTPVRLEANMPFLLEHGTTVHLGGPEAGFTYDFE